MITRPFAPLLNLLKNHAAARDAVVIFGTAAIVLAFAFVLDLADRLHEFMQQHEAWELDEFFFVGGCMSFAMLIFGMRRVQDQRREIALRQKAETAARAYALHDPLTGLPNRRQFSEAMDAALARKLHPDHCHALLLLDLNGFKHVNDVFGHPAGDELLIRISERMQKAFGEQCLIARLGGDEFAVLASDIAGPQAATSIARRVVAAFENPFAASDSEHFVNVGIGIALSPQDGVEAAELMRRADIALYRAKAAPGSSSCFFETEMDNHVRNRMEMEREMRGAIENGELVPHYQPLVDLKTGAIIGFEALARWSHPVKGNIPPNLFIPVAEDTALIRDLTESILRTSCKDAVSWPADILLSVNLSAVLLKDRTIGLRILAILGETGLAPSRLEIEITESALVNDLELAQEVLGDLRKAGVRIALDDFGTGYSSIYHLRSFRFDKIKIDRSYVQALGLDTENDAIVRAMLGLGQGLGLTITAEGIEDPAQRDALILTGCQEGQGYLFGKAVPAEQALGLLTSGVLGKKTA